MITRACISINNQCNLRCVYCHFSEKQAAIAPQEMDVFAVLDRITQHIDAHQIARFTLGFVGNGEPFLAFNALKTYLLHIAPYLKSGKIAAYTITNGTLATKEQLQFLYALGVRVGYSLDGIQPIHDVLRCQTFDVVMQNIALYHQVTGESPSINCTVGQAVLAQQTEVIAFLAQFGSRITFSRMIGKYGISLAAFRQFMAEAKKQLNVRTGGYDCTMYGGLCGAGLDNIFYANGRVYLCGNCIDLGGSLPADIPLDVIAFALPPFDRHTCYKEGVHP